MGNSLPRLSELVPPRQPAAALIRYLACLTRTRAQKPVHVLEAAEAIYPGDVQLHAFLKAAVASGSLSNLSALSPYRTLINELITVARPSSIVLRLSEARVVPMRVRVPRTTAGATVGWVGEGLPKPVTALGFDEVTLDPKKLASIVLLTSELAQFSSPSAEAIIRADLIASINLAVDAALVSNAAATSAKPAGILNGVSAITSTGSTAAAISKDLNTVISAMITAGGMAQSLVILAHPGTAAQIALTLSGAGAALGLPVLISTAVAAGSIVVLDQSELLLADEGIELALSNQATIQSDSAPSDPPASTIGLWQNNLEAIRAERTINWVAARSNAAMAGAVVSIA